MAQFHQLTINQITRETAKAISISFNVPEHLKQAYEFKAGQYLTLKTVINDNEIRRDYSICSSVGSGILKVAVKEVENGIFSTFVNQTLKVGDTLDVATPQGRFTFEPDANKQRTIVAFAAGSGITPIMGILKTLLEKEPNSNFILVYGNKTPDDTIFYNELKILKQSNAERLQILEVYSKTNIEDALFGRIDRGTVNYVLKNKLNDTSSAYYYLCGPEEMITTVSDTLIENEIASEHIKFELFTATSGTTESNTVDVIDGNSQITVLVDDDEITFEMPKSKTILEVALSKNVDAPYSCQGGVCSSCIARVTEGEVTMRQNNILTDSELAEGLILTCQAQPTTNKVIVDYDDV